jgi:putative DNA primase/helicase
MERLFTVSALNDREKWSERADYRERTIQAAIAATTECYEPKPNNVTPMRTPTPMPGNQPRTDGANALAPEPTPIRSKPEKGEKLPLTKMLADAIAEAGEYFAIGADGILKAYKNGTYQASGDEVIRGHVKRLLVEQFNMPASWTIRRAEEVIGYISVDAPRLLERPPLDVLNVKNGLLDVASRVLTPHTPSFLSPVQLPVIYDAKATCPAIDRFVNTAFPEDSHSLAYEIAAWLMLPDTDIQKAVMLTGEGGNGKSRFLRLILAFLGRENVCAESLQRLESDRFAPARLYGKMANICADLPATPLEGTSVFKKITGGDAMHGENKYRTAYDFIAFARLLFSANEPPRSPDGSQAFYDRWIVVPFTGRFRDTKDEIKSKELDAMLAAPGELSGLLNKALDALPGVRENGLTETDTTRAALAGFRLVTDPLAIWLETRTVFDPEAVTPRTEVQRACQLHMIEVGKKVPSDMALTQAIHHYVPDVECKQRTVDGRVQWCYVGLRLTPQPTVGKRQASQPSQPSQPFSNPYLFSTSAPETEDDRPYGWGDRERAEMESQEKNKDRGNYPGGVE